MLAEDKEEFSQLEEWLNCRLSRLGRPSINLEDNQFTREYLAALKEQLVSLEIRLQDECHTRSRQLEMINLQVGRCEKILERLGITETGFKAEKLGRLLAECEAPTCDPHHIIMHLDRLVVDEERLEESLAHLNRITNESSTLFERTEDLKSKLTAALNDFEGWGRRDCELGIRELESAAKAIGKKRDEYRERLDHLKKQWNMYYSTTIDDILTVELLKNAKLVEERRQVLDEIKRTLEPFNKLPPDITLASVQVEEAKRKLDRLIAERDQILRQQHHWK